MSARSPDVVLVVLDSVRRDHLSCYGYGRETTPHVDRLAREGTRYDRASAASCWTLPSHASLFTGRYPSEHRADLDTGQLDPEVPTLAESFRDRGYDTACVTCNGFVAGRTGLDRGFDVTVDVHDLAGGGDGIVDRTIRAAHRRIRRWTETDRGAKRATREARRWLSARPADRPLFLFLNYMDCHLPYALRGPERYRFVAPEDRERVDAVPQDPFGVMAGRTTMSRRDLQDLRALYDGGLRYLDRHVGRLRETLEQLGRWEDTVFVVTSDHGESFGEHGLMDHQYGLYQELLSVPFVVRTPGGPDGGRPEEDGLFQLVDVPELLLALADGQRSPRLGRDLAFAEYLVPNLEAIRRRFPDADVDSFDVAMRSATGDRWKLIWRDDGRRELYDLGEDPDETADLAWHRPDLVRQLEGRIQERLGGWPTIESGPVLAGEGMQQVRDRLEALGYL